MSADDVSRIDGTPGSYPLTQSGDPSDTRPPAEYRKTATVLAAQLTTEAVVVTPEGEIHAVAGDYLLQDPDDGRSWPVGRERFEATYEST